MMNNNENIEKINTALGRLEDSKSIVYFLTYDTKNNARASVKYIYDLALTLNQNGITSKILVEDSTYVGVESWLGDKYKELEVVSIKEDKVEINIEKEGRAMYKSNYRSVLAVDLIGLEQGIKEVYNILKQQK